MTMTADQRLIAYLDNELSADERVQFEADMAKDEWLASEVAKHRGLAARIAQAHAPAPDEAASGRLRMLAQPSNKRAGRRFPAGQWVGMAVCVALGVSVGVAYWPLQTLVQPAPTVAAAVGSGPLALGKDGVLTAQGALEKALTTQLAAQAGPIAVGLTFRGRNGRYCRTFESIPDHLTGVACREADDHWVIQTTTRFMPTAPTADYKSAGSDIPEVILASVAALKAEDPMSALEERAARDKGWKPDQAPEPAPKAEPSPKVATETK
jgi:hypothetical protein